MKYKLIAVDLQNDFTTEGGMHYRPRLSVQYVKENIFPYLKENNIYIDEIISDYRAPRPGDRGKGCDPGTWGYESIVPREIVHATWLKCMNSPLWVRDNIGDETKPAGNPRQDVIGFNNWLEENIGKPGEVIPVVFGLTIDCCILSTLQELSWRGYFPLVLKEGVDHFSGIDEDKEIVIKTTIRNWAKVITWEELKQNLI